MDDEQSVIGIGDLGSRLIIAQSWFIASELVRRHPDLRLIETNPCDGQYNCLSLYGPQGTKPSALIQLNRNGSMSAMRDGEQVTSIPWSATLSQFAYSQATPALAYQALKQLEHHSGLGHPVATPPSSPAALSFRAIARVLTSLLNDKSVWDARNEREDSSGWSPTDRGYVTQFPAAHAASRYARRDDILGVPTYRFWALLKDSEAVAILDTEGNTYTRDGTEHLPTVYQATGRNLTLTIARALGPVLP